MNNKVQKFTTNASRDQYLLNADPTDVLCYLDAIALQSKKTKNRVSEKVSDDILEKLFTRDERLVDLGIALICDADLSQKILERRRDDEEILQNLLSNEVSVAGLYNSPRWIDSIFNDLMISTSNIVLEAYLNNKSISPKAIIKILTREGVLSEITDDKYYLIIQSLLLNPIIKTPPEDSVDYDLSQHSIIGACWELLINLPVNETTAGILSNRIENFSEFEISYSFALKNKIIQDKKNPTKWMRDSEILFLTKILDKWTYKKNKESEDYQQQEEEGNEIQNWSDSWSKYAFDNIRYQTILKIPRYDLQNLKEFLLSIDDEVTTSAYFNAEFDDSIYMSEAEIEKLYTNHGRSFLLGAINTKAFYKKKFAKQSQKIYGIILNFVEAPDTDEFDKLTTLINFNLKRFQNNASHNDIVESLWEIQYYEEESIQSEESDQKDITGKIKELSTLISEMERDVDKENMEVINAQDTLSQQLLLISKNIDTLFKEQSRSQAKIEGTQKLMVEIFKKTQNYFVAIFIFILILLFNT